MNTASCAVDLQGKGISPGVAFSHKSYVPVYGID